MKQDLIHKLKELQEIKPSNEFAAVSKLIILSGESAENLSWKVSLAQKLGHLKRLSPRTHFSAVSREFILNRQVARPTTLSQIFKKSFNYGLALGVTVVFMALITSVGYLGFLSPIPTDIYGKNLTDASDAIKDIDIHLQEAEYFAATDSTASLALREASTTSLIDNTSPTVIERESHRTDFKDPRNMNIDKLLNQATL